MFAPDDRCITLPNGLSALRIAAVPLLLGLAWANRPAAFLAVVCAALLTDVIDGPIARRRDQASALGARLDAWGDLALYGTMPLGGWWLWPDRIRPELPALLVLGASYAAPIVLGFVRFRRLTNHRTPAGRLSAWLLGAGGLLLIGGCSPWPFRLAVLVVVLADLEEIAISAALPRDTPSASSLQRAARARGDAGVSSRTDLSADTRS